MHIFIKDYNLQNILYVHNFVMTILIVVLFFVSIYLWLAMNKYNIDQKHLIWKIEKWSFLNKKKALYLYINYYRNLIKNTKKNTTQLYKLRDDLNFTHNILLEIIWTIIPILFILEMIFPSLSLIADDEIDHKGSIYTISIIGNQWYWNYELNIMQIVIKYVSNLLLLERKERKHFGLSRLLTTTKTLPISVGLKTSFYITSNDVAHSWAIAGLGLKVDAIPGRINLKTIIPTRVGLYSGMCSELCGVEHGFMPISLQILTFADFWNMIKLTNMTSGGFTSYLEYENNLKRNETWQNIF